MTHESIVFSISVVVLLMILLVIIMIHKYNERHFYFKSPKIGQLWIRSEENPFKKPKYLKIIDIKENEDGDLWIKTCRVYENEGVYYSASSNIDICEFKYFKQIYKLVQDEKNNTLGC